MNKIYIDWEDFGIMLNKLIDKVKEGKEQFDGIYGVPRGGLAIALAFSHALKLPVLLYPTEESLVVDDISDSGNTLQNIKHKRIACLFSTDWTFTTPDYWIEEKLKDNDWIVFPWEEQC